MIKDNRKQLQSEVLSSLPNKPHGRLHLAPRSGKTKIIIDLIKREKPKSILWVTPSSKLAEEDIPAEFDKWRAKSYKKKLTTTTYHSLSKIEGVYEMVVFDEEQHITENNIQNFLNGSLKYDYIISMTGTPTKHDHKKDLYKKLDLKVLYNISIKEAVNKNILSNYKISILPVSLSEKKDIVVKTKNKEFKTSERDKYKYLDKTAQQAIYQKRSDKKWRIMERLRFIKNSVSKTEAAKNLINRLEGKTLIFAGSIQQAEDICEHTYHSKTDDKDLKKFLNNEIKKISMVNSGGTGFTYLGLDNLVIVQSDSNKNGQTSQKISRILLSQKDHFANIWILYLKGTKDEVWFKSTLEDFDKSKVEIVDLELGDFA